MPRKILIVDDNPDMRTVLAMILSGKGYSIVQAESGAESIRKSLSENPDLIIMDVNLADMSGAEAATRIKNNDRTASIPIIAHTAWQMKIAKKLCVNASFSDFLVKPVGYGGLTETVERFVGKAVIETD